MEGMAPMKEALVIQRVLFKCNNIFKMKKSQKEERIRDFSTYLTNL